MNFGHKQHKTPDARRYRNTYVCQLHKVPDGARVRHVEEDTFGIKMCDAFQRTSDGRTVIWARGDLVEVFK